MLGLRTTIYKVSDLEKAKDWYAKAFDKQPYFDEPFYIGYNIGGFELGLQPRDNDGEQKTEAAISYWGVDNINNTYQKLLDLGASEYEKPTNVGGEIVVASVKCPWNNIIGIIYNPEFKIEN
ncbi:VOC family protein [Aquimarina aggregata]|uniref:VOC family protein n=1 Tax=Aquimarina aggregata TaxID=1642818 RepID=UPI002492441C|nr:VOC family protein [Aquimarina aggregata]